MSQKGALAQQMPTNFVPVSNTKSISEIQSQMKAEGWIKKTVDPTNMVWSPGK